MLRSLCNHSTPFLLYLWICWRNIIYIIHIVKMHTFQEFIFIFIFILDVASSLRMSPLFCIPIGCPQWSMFPDNNQRNLSFLTPVWWVEKSMSSVNCRWSNYLLSLHSFQSEHWAWLNEYNPLILFRSLIKKPGNSQMWLDRCWESGLIFLIALYSSGTVHSLLLSFNLTNG